MALPSDSTGQVRRHRRPVLPGLVLIVLGFVLLADNLGWHLRLGRYAWPGVLIGLGLWFVVRATRSPR